MRLLWTLSNWKRTGPVEPSLDLAAAVASKGHEVEVLAGRAPAGTRDDASAAARDRGLAVADIGQALGKHRSPLRDWRDVRRLRRHLARTAPDAIVTTLPNDHRIAVRARGARDGPRIARLAFSADPRPRIRAGDLWFRLVPGRSPQAGPPGVVDLDPALDIASLTARAADPAGARAALGVAADDFLFGIVARMQTHRRFELLWEAVRELAASGVRFRLAAIGRGTNQAAVAHEPVRALGLEDVVCFPGYLREEAYASTLAALDAQLFLVPGSDPTCRALREGMALGVPSLVTAREPLPAIVADGSSGRVLADETPACLAAAMRAFVEDRPATRAMGEAAAVLARTRYDAGRVAERFLAALES